MKKHTRHIIIFTMVSTVSIVHSIFSYILHNNDACFGWLMAGILSAVIVADTFKINELTKNDDDDE